MAGESEGTQKCEIVWTPGESEGNTLFGHLVRAKVTQCEIVWTPGESEGNTEV